jgi:hypothetical protein
VRQAKEPPRCGATAAGTSGVYILKLLEETLGTRFNIVSGYQGVRDIDLAVERGEVHCRAMRPQRIWRASLITHGGRTGSPVFWFKREKREIHSFQTFRQFMS